MREASLRIVLLVSVAALAASLAVAPVAAERGAPVRAGDAVARRIARPPSYRTIVPASVERASAALRMNESPSVPVTAHVGRKAPTSVAGFNGVGDLSAVTPADPAGAVGGSYVLAAVNVDWAIYSKAGGPAVAGPFSLKSLFPGVHVAVTDPKVVYDQYSDTFVLAFLGFKTSEKRSFIFTLAMPASSPLNSATWCTHKIRGDQRPNDGRQLADYPAVGFDQNRLYVSTDQFDFGNHFKYRGAQVLAFAKAPLYTCSGPLSYWKFLGKRTTFPDGRQALAIQPAVTVGSTSTPEYMMAYEWGCSSVTCSGSKIGLWSVDDSGASPVLAKASISVGKSVIAPPGTQEGHGISNPDYWWDTGDLRFINCFYDSNADQMYAAHAVSYDVNPGDGYIESAIRWYEVDPASPLSSSTSPRQGVVGTSLTDAGWPVVATDGSGNLFVAYSRASGNGGTAEYLSAYAATIPPAATTPDGITLLDAGQAPYNYVLPPQGNGLGIERWGDFNAISRDPTDPSKMWMWNQVAKSIGPGDTYIWQQVIDEVAHT